MKKLKMVSLKQRRWFQAFRSAVLITQQYPPKNAHSSSNTHQKLCVLVRPAAKTLPLLRGRITPCLVTPGQCVFHAKTPHEAGHSQNRTEARRHSQNDKGKEQWGVFWESKPSHAAKVFTTTNYVVGTLYALQAGVLLYC